MDAAEQAPPERRSSYLALAKEIQEDLEEYDAIRAGRVNRFKIDGFDSVGDALVKARLAKGWTHRQLAQALEVSEQMVQRDEARSYENAGLARMAEVADVLGYDLVGSLQPSFMSSQAWQPQEVPAVMNVSFGVLITGPSWIAPIPSTSQNFTSGILVGVQHIGQGNPLGSLPPILAAQKAVIESSYWTENVVAGSGTFDSAATIPLEIAGGTP